MILTKQRIAAVDLNDLTYQKVSCGKAEELLYVVPTNRKVRALKKEFIAISLDETLTKTNVETLGTLSSKLLSVFKNFKPLTETASSVLLKQSIKKCEMKYFSNYENNIPEGTINRVSSVISEYKKQGITPDKIIKEAEKLTGTEKVKALDIANIYFRFNNICTQLSVKEIGDVYQDLIATGSEKFNSAFMENYNQVDTVIINGFDEFSNLEIEIIDLLSFVPRISLYLYFDYSPGNSFIFSHLDKCYDSLYGKGFRPIIDKTFTSRTDFTSLIQEKLFKPNSDPPIKSYKEMVTEIVGGDREKEIEIIAKEIKNVLLNAETEPHKICIAFNLIDKYSPLVREIFSSMQIPFNLTDRLQLSKSYPVIGIINFLEILENDFYYKNIFRALSCGYFDFGNIELSKIMSAAENLKIISGYNIWIQKLQKKIIELNEDFDLDEYEKQKFRQTYNKVLVDIQSINKLLAPFDKNLTLKEFLVELKKLIFSLKLPIKLLAPQSGREEEHIKAAFVFLDAIEEVFVLLQTESDDKKKFPLNFFLDQLKIIAQSTRFNIKERSNYGVQITTINEIRGLQFDYLFLSGLCEGDFPTRFNPEIFFSGSFQKGENIHQTEERYHFYQSLSCWNNKLYLTYPLTEKEKELIPSNFLRDIKSLLQIEAKTEKDYFDSVFSKAEVLKSTTDETLISIEDNQNLLSMINWENVSKAKKIEKLRRENPAEENIFNGYINPANNEFKISENAFEKLKSLEDRQYSATQLEKYALCPYQYFIERILNIEMIGEPTEEVEAFELGTLLHTILYEFYSTITSEQITIKNCSKEKFDYLINLIFEVAVERIEDAQLNPAVSFYEKEKILGIDGNKEESILYQFLKYERESETGFVPKFFETVFGELRNSGKGNISLNNFSIDKIKLRGKIDRLEINEDDNAFNVVDYKLSGKKPTEDDLLNGLSLQLPVYMIAAKEILKKHFNKDYDPAGALIYSLKFNEKDFGRILIGKRRMKEYSSVDESKKKEIIEYYNTLLDACKNSITSYVENIKTGKFNLSMLKEREAKVCGYCSFKPVCRIQTVK